MSRHASLRVSALVGALLITSGLVLAGCASSRLIKNPAPATPADVGWVAAAPGGLTVEVHQLIVRNGGGSWVHDANWDEYVLTIRNDSEETCELLDINLYSDRIPAAVESSISREQLDARSNSTLRALKDVGIVGGAGIVAPSALIVSAVGTSGGIASAATAGAAAVAIGVVAVPVGLIGGTTYVISRHRRDKRDAALIERTLRERGFAIPLQIPPGTQLQKSAFFPVTPAPSRLVVTEAIGGNAGELAVDLPALERLHLKPLPALSAAANLPRATN